MSINNCSMRESIGNETFCGYYDVGCVICDGINCPEEEDDDDDWDIDYESDYLENENNWY